MSLEKEEREMLSSVVLNISEIRIAIGFFKDVLASKSGPWNS